MPHSVVNTEPIIEWLTQTRSVIGAAMGPCRVEPDCDLADALLVPLYLKALNRSRNRSSSGARSMAATLNSRIMRSLYQAKMRFLESRAARHVGTGGKADVLFLPREITHVAQQRPVMVTLNQAGISTHMLSTTPRVHVFCRELTRHASFAPGLWGERLREARHTGHRHAAEISPRAVRDLPLLKLKDRQIDLVEAVLETLREQLPTVYESALATTLAIQEFQPAVLVAGNDLTMEGRVACQMARAQGRASAVLMHGSVSGDKLQFFHNADAVFLFGEIARRDLALQGVSAERIRVTGAPYLDRRPRQWGSMHPKLAQHFGWPQDAQWILVATSGPGNRISEQHHRQVVAAITSLAESFPDLRIAVKMHRKDHRVYYAGTPEKRMPIIASDAPGLPDSIFDWLQGCSMVLTGASTVAQEAMLMGVPVISMDFNREISGVDFIDAGATLHVESPDELRAAVTDVLRGADRVFETGSRAQQHLAEAFHNLSGGSSRETAQGILELIPRVTADRPPSPGEPLVSQP